MCHSNSEDIPQNGPSRRPISWRNPLDPIGMLPFLEAIGPLEFKPIVNKILEFFRIRRHEIRQQVRIAGILWNNGDKARVRRRQ